MFRKLDLFPSGGGGETPTLLGHSEGANLNHTKSRNPVILSAVYHRQNPYNPLAALWFTLPQLLVNQICF
jgi:hypothetical protein